MSLSKKLSLALLLITLSTTNSLATTNSKPLLYSDLKSLLEPNCVSFGGNENYCKKRIERIVRIQNKIKKKAIKDSPEEQAKATRRLSGLIAKVFTIKYIDPRSISSSLESSSKEEIIIVLEKILEQLQEGNRNEYLISTLSDLYITLENLNPPTVMLTGIKDTISKVSSDEDDKLTENVKIALAVSKAYSTETDSIDYDQVGLSLITIALETELQRLILLGSSSSTTLSVSSLRSIIDKLPKDNLNIELEVKPISLNIPAYQLLDYITITMTRLHANEPMLMMIGWERTLNLDDLRIALAVARAFNKVTNTVEPNKLARSLVISKLESALQYEILGDGVEYDRNFSNLADEVRSITGYNSVYLDTLEQFIESYEKAIAGKLADDKQNKIRNQLYIAREFPNTKIITLMIGFAEQALRESILSGSNSSIGAYFDKLNLIIDNTPSLSLDSESERQSLRLLTGTLKDNICTKNFFASGGMTCKSLQGCGYCSGELTADEIKTILISLREAQKKL